MNIIIVGKPLSAPKNFRLHDWRTSLCLALITLALVALIAGTGYGIGTWVGMSRNTTLAELHALRGQVEAFRAQVASAREESQHDINALAARVGELQAQAIRLNALGERLTRLGKLEDGEFNFREAPALGGPENVLRDASGDLLLAGLEQVDLMLSDQARQLDLLASLLLDRELDESMMPAGMPVAAGYRSSGFGHRADPFTGRQEFHRGIDFNAPRGTEIIAVADGVVAFAGRRPGYGNTVEIDHGNGYRTRYAHNDRNLVKVGERVRTGDVIATMGASGRATGVHLHFEVWHNGRAVNPSQYVRGGAPARAGA
jgi:murein DD-endopeptidase MepM/ murein hydrolase activator NlpD